jgi:hypothetical protein
VKGNSFWNNNNPTPQPPPPQIPFRYAYGIFTEIINANRGQDQKFYVWQKN